MRGRVLRQRLEPSGFQPPAGNLLDPGTPQEPGAMVNQVTLILGAALPVGGASRVFTLHGVRVPPASADAVERLEGGWIYLTASRRQGAPDLLRRTRIPPSRPRRPCSLFRRVLPGRVIVLDGPRGEEGASARGGWATPAGEPDAALPGHGGPSTQAVVELFQQTLKELRKRTEELEEMHQRERGRAEDVERMAEALCTNFGSGVSEIRGGRAAWQGSTPRHGRYWDCRNSPVWETRQRGLAGARGSGPPS